MEREHGSREMPGNTAGGGAGSAMEHSAGGVVAHLRDTLGGGPSNAAECGKETGVAHHRGPSGGSSNSTVDHDKREACGAGSNGSRPGAVTRTSWLGTREEGWKPGGHTGRQYR